MTRRYKGKLELPLAYKFILERLNLSIKEKTVIIADKGLNKLSEYHTLLLLTGALNQHDRRPSSYINKDLIFPVIFYSDSNPFRGLQLANVTVYTIRRLAERSITESSRYSADKIIDPIVNDICKLHGSVRNRTAYLKIYPKERRLENICGR